MTTVATRPLNDAAMASADEDIYAAHAADPRPNALFDADGRRLALHPTDPAQEALREEWFDYYERHGGGVEDADTPSNRKPDEPVEPCRDKDELLLVELVEAIDDDGPLRQRPLDADRRQWINLAQPRDFDLWTRVGLRARVAWKSGKTDGLSGHAVHFRLETLPGARTGLPSGFDAHMADGGDVAVLTSDGEGWTDTTYAILSRYAGDRCRFRATLDGAAMGGLETAVVTVWNKVFYSVDTMNAPNGSPRGDDVDFGRLEAVMADRFIAFQRVGVDGRPPYKKVIETSEVAEVAGSLPKPGPLEAPHLRFLLCHIVADYEDIVTKAIVRRIPRSGVIELINGVAGRTLNLDDWIGGAEWRRRGREWAPFPLANLSLAELSDEVAGYRIFADARGVPGLKPHQSFRLKLRLRMLNTLRGFQSDATLVIAQAMDDYRGRADGGALHTSIHEAGHALGLAPETTPEGAANPFLDDTRGGHCGYGDMDCVMYPGGPDSVIEFCPTCSDSLRARRLSKLPRRSDEPH